MPEVKLIDNAPIGRSQWVTIQLQKDAHFVNLTIYDIGGNLVRREALGPVKVGTCQWFWDGKNDMNKLVGPGVYYITIFTA